MQASYESRAAPAVFATAPVTALQPQRAQQVPLFTSSPQPDQAQDRAVAVVPQHRVDPTAGLTATPTSQVAAPRQAQLQAGGPDSPTVHKSAESIIAREPAKPASKAATKAASKGKSAGDNGDDDDVELAPEEMGFAGHSDDTFAGDRKQFAHDLLIWLAILTR